MGLIQNVKSVIHLSKLCIVALSVMLGSSIGNAAYAFDTLFETNSPMGTCSVYTVVRPSNTYAEVYFFSSVEGADVNAGGNRFLNNAIEHARTISAADIAACFSLAESNVTLVSQNGADGVFADDNYIGFVFSLDTDAGGYVANTQYEFKVGTESRLDTTAPTLSLETAPVANTERIEADELISINFLFNENVADFTFGDIQIENAQPCGKVGLVEEVATSFYTLCLQPDGNGDIKVTVPAGVYDDLAGNVNTQEVSIMVAVGDPVNEVTEKVVKDGLKRVQGNLLHANRNMTGFRRAFRRQFGGRVQASGDSQGGNGFLSLQGENGGWAELQGVWSDVEGVSSSYFHGALGFHNYVTDTMVVGGMLQFDRSDAETDTGDTIDIQGWMVGPYILGEVPGQDLIYDLRVLYGRGTGDSEIASSGTTGSFDLERLMVMGTLEGNYKVNEVTWSPYISGSYARTEAGAYTDSAANAIAAQTSTASEGELGLTGTFPMGDGSISAGLSAVASREDDVSQDARGKVNLGLYQPVGSGDLTLDFFYDGLGRDDYEAYGVTAKFEFNF